MRGRTFIAMGMPMLVFGGSLFFYRFEALPLWITWIIGPLCWYLGFAVVATGVLIRAFEIISADEPEAEAVEAQVPKKKIEETITVIHFANCSAVQSAPSGVLHEIPAMGGFGY